MSDNLVLLSELIIRNPDIPTFKDLDPVTATRWGAAMTAWAADQNP